MSCCSAPDDDDNGKAEIKVTGGRVVSPMKMDIRWTNKEFHVKSNEEYEKQKGTISINTACIIADSVILCFFSL